MTRPLSSDDEGMILVNVLVIVMLATAVLALMIAGDDSDVEFSLRLGNAAQARAVTRGAELSAIAELRRDMVVAPEVDKLSEQWAKIADTDVAIEGGRFTYAVSDAQALFNINNLQRGDALNVSAFAAIVAAAGLPPDTAPKTAALLSGTGTLSGLDDLRTIGLRPDQILQLGTFCTVLPEPTDVNLNTAPEPLIAALIDNPGLARMLVGLRARDGGLTRDALSSAGVFAPPGTGVTSNYFWSSGHVVIGSTDQRLTSLLYRRIDAGRPAVLVLKRWRGAAPFQVPPLAEVTRS